MATRTYRKSILSVGTHKSPDGELDVTPERLAHWAEQHERMTKNRQVVPMHWDHGKDRQSLTPIALDVLKAKKTRSAKDTKGRLESFKVAEDGQSAEITYEVTGKDAIEQFDANTVFVSPVIMPDWKDGAGNEYTDAITHLDIVNYPVDHQQSNAEPVGTVGLGLRLGLDTAVYRLALHDKEKLFGDGDSDHDSSHEPTELEHETEHESSSTSTVAEAIRMLEQIGIPIGEDTDGNNFIERFVTGARVYLAQQNAEPGEPEMSQDRQVVETPPTTRMSLEAKTLRSYAERQHREAVIKRLRLLLDSGRCTPDEFKTKQAATGAIKLSLDTEGKPAESSVESWIASREPVPARTFWTDQQKLDATAVKLSTVGHPDPVTFGEGNGNVTEQEADKVLEELEESGLVSKARK